MDVKNSVYIRPPIVLTKAGKSPYYVTKTHDETAALVEKLLSILHIPYSTHKSFLGELEKKLPFMHWEIAERAPGEISIYLLTKQIKDHDIGKFFSDMVGSWLLTGLEAQILSTKQATFYFQDFIKTGYFVSEIICFIEDETSLFTVKERIGAIESEIALGATSPHHARHIFSTMGLSLEQKTALIHKTILNLSEKKFQASAADIYVETHHFLLACDDEFKRLRDVAQMVRIICYHNWFRRKHRQEKKQSESGTRKISFKIMKTSLKFAFGQKKVLGIVISINFLHEYERFQAKHILRACQKLLPHNISIVPHSFFSYEHPVDGVHSFYMEIEKKEEKDFKTDEIQLLKRNLEHELSLSIEQLSHKLFMPPNEEEVFRNIMLLNQEIRYVKDIPHVIVSFRGQTETSLSFLVIVVHVIHDDNYPRLEQLLENRSPFIRFSTHSKKIVGYIRNKYPKEAYSLFVECQKSPFIRQDHSIDLLRAREYVLVNIQRVLGKLRDFNGGLIWQQNQLLSSIKEHLSQDELKHEFHLDNLFHSISPILMKSLLPPEAIKTLLQLFLELSTDESVTTICCKEVRIEQGVCVMISSQDAALLDDAHKHIMEHQCKDLELAQTSLKAFGSSFQGYVLLSQNAETLKKFLQHVHAACSSKNALSLQTLKISLPRPTSLLDPRIGTDKTSGIVIKMLYEGLMRLDGTGKPTFALAERVDISEDQKTYTFTLRDTKWSNGKPVTAYDFEYAWKKILDPHFQSIHAYVFHPIRGAKLIKKGKQPLDTLGVHVANEKTLVVELEHPAPYFLELTAHWIYSPLCKEIDELHPGWAYYVGEDYVCNGPFKLAKKRGSQIVAIKNSQYWDKDAVSLNQIEISVIENPKAALLRFQKGQLDWLGEPLSEIPPEALKKKTFEGKIHYAPIAAVHWYECNVKTPPFASEKCRVAFSLALNRKAIIDEFFHGGEIPAYSILPPDLSSISTNDPSAYDMELAQKLFLEGLKEQNLTPETLPKITINCADQEIHIKIAESVAKQWKAAFHIDIDIESFRWEHFMQKGLRHEFQIMGLTWYSWFNDPIYNLSHAKYQKGDISMTQWEDSLYISLLERAESTRSLEERKELLKQAEQFVMQKMPIIPVFYYTFKYMKKDSVKNVFLSRLGQIDFKWGYSTES
jgi:oligopeptide transport system substrate-binding protein